MTLPELGPLPDAPLAVAVSGGGDSVALLMLLKQSGHQISAVTIDHQLRPESAAEAETVAALCADQNIPHTILKWQDRPESGNLQNEARNARRHLLARFAQDNGFADVVLGHTMDDQAETVLMRLARGSGVDGLSGIAAVQRHNNLNWHHPLLSVRRSDLRRYLQAIHVDWVDDPSNDDLKYDRIKARQALEILKPLGIDSQGLADTASHMRRARHALDSDTRSLALECLNFTDIGEAQMRTELFLNAPAEIRLRLLSAVLRWVSGAPYRPRFAALEALLNACESLPEFGKTLHGCAINLKNGEILVNREVSATSSIPADTNTWDQRWKFDPKDSKHQIQALGPVGLPQCPDWRETGFSRASLLASPSLWQENRLIAAPFANFGDNWRVDLARDIKGFYDLLSSH